MVFLPFSNIVVDQFAKAKQNPNVKYIHFLTHMHSDHHIGMSEGWNYGRLYCSEVTSQLLRQKFGHIEQVIPLEIGTRYVVQIGDQLNINVTLFDANHCPGAVMFLFEGYFGTYLYTGDIRFNRQVFEEYYDLYPEGLRTEGFIKCSKKIDILYLDNTFCDPAFTFPPQSEVLKQITELVQRCKDQRKKVLIALDSLGKQQILIHLAYQFHAYIAVSNMKYYSLLNSRIDSQMFTKNGEMTWIEVIAKGEMKSRLSKDPNAVGIIPTGWCNNSFSSMEGRLWMFPYSLHSNYSQLEAFMKSLNVAQVFPIVRNFQSSQKLSKDYGDVVKEDSIYRLSQLKQRGLRILQQKYTTKQHTEQYNYLFSNMDFFKQVAKCYTIQQKKLPLNYAQSYEYRRAEDVKKIIEQRKRQDQQIRERKQKKMKDDQQKRKRTQEQLDNMRVNLVKSIEQKKQQMRRKGIHVGTSEEMKRERQEKEKEIQREKEAKLNNKSRSRSGSRSRSISKEGQKVLKPKRSRKTQLIKRGNNKILDRKTTKVQKKLTSYIPIQISSDSDDSDEQKQEEPLKIFPLKRPSHSQSSHQLTKKSFIAQSKSQKSTQSSYIESNQMQELLRKVLRREKEKNSEPVLEVQEEDSNDENEEQNSKCGVHLIANEDMQDYQWLMKNQ